MICHSERLVVFAEDLPATWGHETKGRFLSILCHLAHTRSRNELKVFLDTAWATEELHSLGLLVVSSNLEWSHICTVEHALKVYKELLSVPDIVAISTLRVLDTSGVSSSNEVGDSAVNSGGGVPQDFSGSTVIHWRRPDSKNGVLRVDGTLVEKSLVLLHSPVKGNIVVLAPSAERVEEKDGVLVSLLDELLTCVLKEEDVTVVERVSDLESVDGISSLGNNLFVDLLRSHSVVVHAVVEINLLDEVHRLSGDEPFTLGIDDLSLGVLGRHASEGSGANLFLSVLEEVRVVDDGENIVGDLGALKSDLLLSGESFLLLGSQVLGDRDGHEVLLSLLVSDGLHVHGLEELHLVHEPLEWEGPSVTNSLEVFGLLDIDVENLKVSEVGLVLFFDHAVNNTGLGVVLKDTVLDHLLDDDGFALGKVHGAGVDVEVTVGWFFVGIRDTSEVLDNSFTGLLVESFDISLFTDFEGGRDVTLVERHTSFRVNFPGEVSVLGVG